MLIKLGGGLCARFEWTSGSTRLQCSTTPPRAAALGLRREVVAEAAETRQWRRRGRLVCACWMDECWLYGPVLHTRRATARAPITARLRQSCCCDGGKPPSTTGERESWLGLRFEREATKTRLASQSRLRLQRQRDFTGKASASRLSRHAAGRGHGPASAPPSPRGSVRGRARPGGRKVPQPPMQPSIQLSMQ